MAEGRRVLWRLVKPEYAPGLDGAGARLAGGRWNAPGVAVVYCSESLALAVLEIFVHLPPALRGAARLPEMTAVKLALPEGASVWEPEEAELPDLADAEDCRAFGDDWVAAARTLALAVPSAVVPLERNWLVNPAHPEAEGIRVLAEAPFRFDARMGV
jgi:RES domain-containing protein